MTTKPAVTLYDTTLRDGTQGTGISFSVLDKIRVAEKLDAFGVQDLNQDSHLAYAAGEFDGAAICVSIQYLTQPVAVLREVGRVLREAAPLVVTFSNRCFPTVFAAEPCTTTWATPGSVPANMAGQLPLIAKPNPTARATRISMRTCGRRCR